MELIALAAVFLMLSPTCAEAIGDMGVCYILDGILVLYGAILTILYCRLKVKAVAEVSNSEKTTGGIYEGLTLQSTDEYETIGTHKKPIA